MSKLYANVQVSMSKHQVMRAIEQFNSDKNLSAKYWDDQDYQLLLQFTNKVGVVLDKRKEKILVEAANERINEADGTCVNSLAFVAPV